MKRLFLSIITVLSLAASTPVEAGMSEQVFSSCEKLRETFEFVHGVARDSRVIGMTGARVNARVYEMNRSLDKDGDGVACELFVYDSGVTTRSLGFTSMYSACKIDRQAEFNMINAGYLDYPYSNGRDELRFTWMGDNDKLPFVRSAAKINPIFQSALKAAEQELKTSTAFLKSWPKDPWTPKRDFNFSNWCALFGIYDSQPGLLPPMSWKPPRKDLTTLNGARGVCKRLFVESPNRVMYSDNDSITLMECDREASSVSRRASDYYEAKDMMIDYLFMWHEYWCWGKECTTRFDLDF
jgi:hypothetical protein